MRFRHRDGSTIHLSYCTNVHPAEDLPGIRAQLAAHSVPIRKRLGWDVLGLGLWLPRPAAEALADDPAAVARLRAELTSRGLEVVSLNGFPYQGFHDPVVKYAVYTPDWTDPRRLAYTLDLARVLAGLLPDDVREGSVSTMPFAWRNPWDASRHDAARRHLDILGRELRRLAADTGRHIRVGLEPEPGCVAETVQQALDALTGTDADYVGLCLDACHLAVAHEDPVESVAAAVHAGRPVVKLQASAALQADRPDQEHVRAVLAPFAEPRFLHQTREAVGQPGSVVLLDRDDLVQALDRADGLPGDNPWRIHYHVPLHADPSPPLSSTRQTLSRTMQALFDRPTALTRHVEVETYTWSVLPGEQARSHDDVTAGVAAELDWTRGAFHALGLTEESTP
ncbi:metabolite traffic protein EboE [Streptomyces sp. NPDC050549]|uniref:metabolite traffic protein EboE n=1 Tax=Streptomyces sp. NPDC050549 TaxID=3155406 RepID=UPI00342DDBC9